MFECEWNDGSDSPARSPVTSDKEEMCEEKKTVGRKKRLKRTRQLLEVLHTLNTPSTLHPDLPPPPVATPPKRRRKSEPDAVTPVTSPPVDNPGVERPPECGERLSRQQWRNKRKNKKKNRNKFKTEGQEGAGATATDRGAGATAALEETPQHQRDKKGKQNGKIRPDRGEETPRSMKKLRGPQMKLGGPQTKLGGPQTKLGGPGDPTSRQVTPRERARLQKLKMMMQREAGGQKAETPREEEEEDPHNTEADNSESVRDRSAELRSRMEQRLSSARFRYINEQLYTSRSEEALSLFQRDPEAFSIYHSGFSQQVQRWPSNPLTDIIKYLKNRPSSLVVADFGCGDALLARSVRNTVHSFDLVALNDHVTVCDIAEVPLQDVSVDVAVFCLSLMGTNLSDFLQEANRVLKPSGVLLVAEVSSRFDDVRQFLSAMSQLGFKVIQKNTENSFFFFFEFSKTGRGREASNHPGLQLRPCLYKKR